MHLGLTNKVVLVAGASKGLGYAIAREFAREGARVAIGSRDWKRIQAAAEAICKETQVEVMASVVDVTQKESIQQWVNEVSSEWGTVHVCVTNTAGPPSMPFMETKDEDWQKAVNLTLMSAVRLSQAVIPLMQKQKWGRIIHLCSASVKNPIPRLIFSNAIRSAVVALGKTQANELAADGILVNSVLPGWADTERTQEIITSRAKHFNISVEEALASRYHEIPLHRMARPEEIAAPIIFLASEQASFITGIALTVDGGETKVPF